MLGGDRRSRAHAPAAASSPRSTVGAAAALELVLWRLFPTGGRFPFSLAEFAAACVSAASASALTWRVERARSLHCVLRSSTSRPCSAVFVVPSAVGENIARLRFAAIPIVRARALAAALAAAARSASSPSALAVSWNADAARGSFAQRRARPDRSALVLGADDPLPARSTSTPSYRVEAVDTAGHWEAVYLPRAGIPLARGWFRQDDFPQNGLLYAGSARAPTSRWLRPLGVRYVVLTDAPPDYSARGEAALLRSGRVGPPSVFRAGTRRVFAVPRPRPL